MTLINDKTSTRTTSFVTSPHEFGSSTVKCKPLTITTKPTLDIFVVFAQFGVCEPLGPIYRYMEFCMCVYENLLQIYLLEKQKYFPQIKRLLFVCQHRLSFPLK